MTGKLVVQGAGHMAVVQVGMNWPLLSCHLLHGFTSWYFSVYSYHENFVLTVSPIELLSVYSL